MGRNAGEDGDRAMRAEPGHGALAFLRKTVIPYKGIFAHGKRLGKGRPHRNRRARRRPAGLSPLFLVRIGCFMTPQRSGQYRNFADYKRQRARMARQLEERGISDEAVLAAMRAVQRHLFVPEALQSRAYEDHPLPIGFGQTISQPAVVAFMTQVLETRPDMRVLEIGTGSGYQTAVLAAMGLRVFTVERVEELHAAARELFAALGVEGVRMKLGDGTLGWKDQAPSTVSSLRRGDRLCRIRSWSNWPIPVLWSSPSARSAPSACSEYPSATDGSRRALWETWPLWTLWGIMAGRFLFPGFMAPDAGGAERIASSVSVLIAGPHTLGSLERKPCRPRTCGRSPCYAGREREADTPPCSSCAREGAARAGSAGLRGKSALCLSGTL